MWRGFIDWIIGGGAAGGAGRTPAASVPEIDASTGMLALAALGAAMLFAWERRRRLARKS
ncbi:MAG: VPEID-CTERM sorting domain-containing protein [Rhodobacteraceae bacterium]|nr:VPEID-CTERM sorting domain-containing protein [Paracoccaceae bacterium]